MAGQEVAEGIVLEGESETGFTLRGPTGARLEVAPETGHGLRVTGCAAADPTAAIALLMRAMERVTATRPAPTPLPLHGLSAEGRLEGALRRRLLEQGLAATVGNDLVLFPEMLWQRPDLWLRETRTPFAQRFALTKGRRHPVRPPKPEGVVYERFIPWLGARFALRTVDVDGDLARFHGWMNDPRVAAIWEEAGDLDRHRAYLQELRADPHMLSLLGAVDGVPFAYFELYWAKENRIAPFYDAGDYDRGWHVLVGEAAFRGRAYVATWLPSLMHYIFLDDPRTMRIVGEPRADHHQQLRNLERSGFARTATFDFPHKRAALVMLQRERFFGDRLWVPDGAPPAVTSTHPAPVPRETLVEA